MDTKFKRELMIEHYKNPLNKGLKNNSDYIKVNTKSESCIDNIDVELKLENDIIKDIRFDGEACAISTSATSIMISILIGKTKEEAIKIIENYNKMINEEEYDENVLEELIVYDEIYKQPSRKRCALIPHDAIKKIIND